MVTAGTLRQWMLAPALAVALGASAFAQESQFVSDMRREGKAIAESCDSVSPKALGGCVYTLVTSYPFHVALGNLPPLNGFGFGGAFSERYTPNEVWRLTFSADAVASMSGSRRVGGYVKFIHTPGLGVAVRRLGDSPARRQRLKLDTWAVDVFGQETSLNRLDYYGEGGQTVESGRAVYGQHQVLFGGAVVLPMSGRSWLGALNPALLGGVTARNIEIRPGDPAKGIPLDQRYDDVTAPGLGRQDAFVEFREGVRLRPLLPGGHLYFNYLVTAHQFVTSKNSHSSFRRVTVDLQHEIPLHRGAVSSGPPRDFNGPNECSASTDSMACPSIRRSRNRTGSIMLRALVVASRASAGARVPFHLQPTLGGSDINGERLLASFADYRFRGSNLIAFQESVEHSLWGPFGVFAMAEQGKVTARTGDLDLAGLKTSATIGLTLRAGGFPMLTLAFSWGAEGNHVLGSMNSSLLGGSARPSLN